MEEITKLPLKFFLHDLHWYFMVLTDYSGLDIFMSKEGICIDKTFYEEICAARQIVLELELLRPKPAQNETKKPEEAAAGVNASASGSPTARRNPQNGTLTIRNMKKLIRSFYAKHGGKQITKTSDDGEVITL